MTPDGEWVSWFLHFGAFGYIFTPLRQQIFLYRFQGFGVSVEEYEKKALYDTTFKDFQGFRNVNNTIKFIWAWLGKQLFCKGSWFCFKITL